MNIIEPILFQCRNNPPGAALAAPGTHFNVISYARLERSIHNICRKALALGLARGNIVAVFVNDQALHALILLALTRLGVITFSGRNPKLPPEPRVNALITDSTFPYQAERVILADASWATGDDKPIDERYVPHAEGDEICRIVLTSGTTGDAKAVALTHRMLAARIARHQYAFGNRAPYCSRTYCDLGFATSLGFQFLIAMLWRGGTLFMQGRDPLTTVNAFDFYQVQNMITSPAGLLLLLRIFDERDHLQSGFETIFSGGSMLPAALSERVRARICSNLITAYGSTEMSMVAAAPAHAVQDIAGAAGYVLPGIAVEIVDENGTTRPRGQEGIVRIRSAFGVDAYIGDAAESATAFRDGWFYPGDTGCLKPDNLLVITGRTTAILNLGGDKVKPEFIEDVLASHPSVEQAAVFSMANALGVEELWAVIVPRAALDEPALRTHCSAKLPPVLVPVRFIFASEMPRNAMGKVERQRLPEFVKTKLH
jgi:acyl-coenzyme A synthetase/AMP-(fatty) acid ligase